MLLNKYILSPFKIKTNRFISIQNKYKTLSLLYIYTN